MSTVYEVMTKISLVNGVSPVIAVIAKDILSLEGSVNSLGKALGNIRTKLAIGGGLAFAGGVAALTGMSKLVEHGEKLVHVKQQLMAADVKGVELAKATAEAWKLSGKYGMDVSHVLADIKEARMVFGSTEHAIEFIDPLEKMRVVLNSVTEGKGNSARDAVYEMARAGELKGLQKPEDFVRYFDQMTKAITASGGKIDPKAFVQATQYGRLASIGWDEEFYTRYLPSMIQEMRPSGAGTALMSLFGTDIQGKVSKRALMAKEKFGLIDDYSKIEYNKLGDPVGMHAGALKGSELEKHNPFRWAQEVLGPALKKKLGENITADNPAVIDALSDMYGNRMSAQAIAILALQGNRLRKDANLIGKAHGIDEADSLLKHDPTAVMNRFKNSWDNLLTSFTEQLVEPKLQIMNRLSDTFDRLAKWAVEHPDAVASFGEGIVKLSAAFVVGGAAALLAAIGPVGWFTAGIVGLGLAFGKFDANTIDNLTLQFDGLKKAIADLQGTSMDQKLKEAGVAWDAFSVHLLDSLEKLKDWVYSFLPESLRPKKSFEDAFGKYRTPGGVSTPFVPQPSGNVYDSPVFKKSAGSSFGDVSERMRALSASNDNLERALNSAGGGFNVRGVKNMNPGNIAWGPWAAAHGAIGSAGTDTGHGVAVFPSHEAGAKALETLALNKYLGGKRSIDQLIAGSGGWTPGNHQAAANVARMMGISAFTDATLDNPAMMRKFRDALMVQELGPGGARHVLERLGKGEDSRLKNVQPVPKKNEQPIHVQTTLNIDGEHFGRMASKHIARNSEHSRQAPYFNSHGMFNSPDTQFAVG